MPEAITKKKGWTSVAFGDVVRLSSERSTNPEAAGYERFVGLEHIDPGDLRVHRWGNIANGVTFTNVFRPGQVLFGKRRAYQRKVAVADFSGVCSGDIYVLEPKNDRLLSELLPYICHTNAFFEHAVGTSAGSLSPRTNWESLACFAFHLPPIEEQRRIAALLSKFRSVMDQFFAAADVGRQLRHSMIKGLIGTPTTSPRRDSMVPIASVCKVVRGSSPRPAGDARLFNGDHIPWITVGEITKGDAIWLRSTETYLTEAGMQRSRVLHKGTVVLTNSGFTLGVPKVLGITGCANDGIAAFLDLDPMVNPLFLYFRLFGMTTYLREVVAAGGDQPNLNTDRIGELLLPLPTPGRQAHVVERLTSLQSGIAAIESRASLLREQFGDCAESVLNTEKL